MPEYSIQIVVFPRSLVIFVTPKAKHPWHFDHIRLMDQILLTTCGSIIEIHHVPIMIIYNNFHLSTVESSDFDRFCTPTPCYLLRSRPGSPTLKDPACDCQASLETKLECLVTGLGSFATPRRWHPLPSQLRSQARGVKRSRKSEVSSWWFGAYNVRWRIRFLFSGLEDIWCWCYPCWLKMWVFRHLFNS